MIGDDPGKSIVHKVHTPHVVGCGRSQKYTTNGATPASPLGRLGQSTQAFQAVAPGYVLEIRAPALALQQHVDGRCP